MQAQTQTQTVILSLTLTQTLTLTRIKFAQCPFRILPTPYFTGTHNGHFAFSACIPAGFDYIAPGDQNQCQLSLQCACFVKTKRTYGRVQFGQALAQMWW